MMDKFVEDVLKKARAKNTGKKALPSTVEFTELKTIENSQNVKLIKGMPIMARKTFYFDDDYDICNNETFEIEDIDLENEIVIIKSDYHKTHINIEFKDFQKCFVVAFCITVHKSQGETYNFQYSIHEWERFSDKMKYVSLSRSTGRKFINIVD